VNDVRFIPEIAGFIYATRGTELFVNLFISSTARFELAGIPLAIKQTTRYPWAGESTIQVERIGSDVNATKNFTLNLRIPGWARNQPVPSDLYRYEDRLKPQVKLSVNGKATKYDLKAGFAQVTRTWKSGDTIALHLDMPVRRVVAHPAVDADSNRFALERGPLVYCAEGADNHGQVLDKVLSGPMRFATREEPHSLGGIVSISASTKTAAQELKCIPYYAWSHRGPNEMRVWFPTTPEFKLASHCWDTDTPDACFDGKEPKDSNDHSIPRFTWWDHTGTTEWIARPFDKPTKVSAVSVYWFDDTRNGGGCRVPKSWRLVYQSGGEWKPVEGAATFGTSLDKYNHVAFTPVTTTALRIEVQLQPQFSGGILEWKCE
jgi:hypothetical protein